MRKNAERILYAARDREGRSRLMLLTRGESGALAMTAVYRTLADRSLFTDFVEYFPYNDGICGVFVNHLEKRDVFLDEFAAHSSPVMRLVALRSLAAALLSQDVPFTVACDLLEKENSFASTSGQVHFAYDLGTFSLRKTDAMQVALARLSAVIGSIVLNDLRSPAMKKVLEGLERGRYCNWHEVYQAAANAIEETDLPPTSPEQEITITVGERVDVLKTKVTEVLTSALARGLILLAFVVLGYLIWATVITAHVDNDITQIGDVEVYHASR
jgi:hypothetical protein